ncbi:MAG: SAM-dependent chlorinase/fluorinase [Desulfarculus sp.]|nr:SAM-dependent chlorinase/fluorinase [Desulfarculus sp.]
MNPPIISLTSDFGPDVFVGLMKGVILGICPNAHLVDLSHAVAPQDVLGGALVLEQVFGVFPAGTVHLAVVDPGVGSQRRGLAIAALGQAWVGPDNGLFTPVLRADPAARAYLLTNRAYFRPGSTSATFHGRDVFAPVAAHLARGVSPADLGPEVADPLRLEWPLPVREGDSLRGQVLFADRFGNLITNLERGLVEAFLAGRPARVELGGLVVDGLAPCYAAAGPGQPLALFNSLERLELAINNGDLSAKLGFSRLAARGAPVLVRALE